MTTKFGSIEEAKAAVAMDLGMDPGKVVFIEDDSLRAISAFEALVLQDPTLPRSRIDEIKKGLDSQMGFRINDSEGNEVRITIAPFVDGFCVWKGDRDGNALRL